MISINNRDPKPIYEQVKEQFRKLIVSGVLRVDDKLPSVRELASSLAINPNTIQRAYRELEAEGYIYSLAGRGSFVGEKREVDSSRRRALLQELSETAKELRFLGMSDDEICDFIREGGNEK